jgi:hypothetical protein
MVPGRCLLISAMSVSLLESGRIGAKPNEFIAMQQTYTELEI